MKRIACYCLLLCCLPGLLVAQINFQKKDWKDLLADAKAQRKLIFVDVYADWCGPCKMLDRDVFSSKEVGKKFNSYFINHKADAEKGGSAIAARYNVRAYPTGLFINGDGELVHTVTGYMPAAQFMDQGEQAFQRTGDGNVLSLYMKAYNEGNRAPVLIRSLLKLRKRYGQETNAILDNYLATLPADSLGLPINLLIAYENVERVDTRAFAVMIANKHDDRFRDRARIILSTDVTQSAENRDEKRLPILMAAIEKLETENVEEQKAEYRTQFYQTQKEWKQYAEHAGAYAQTHLLPKLTSEAKAKDSVAFWTNYNKLCSIGWYFFKEVKDEAKLKTITDYVRQANQLIETPNATGVCACLLYQMGQKEQAVQLQEKAISLAEQTGSAETETYKATLKRMQKGKSL